MTMNGPSEFTIIGNLEDWSVKGKLHVVKNDVLLLNGRYDEATDMVVKAYWRELGGRTRWYTFAEGSHVPHWEQRDHFMQFVATWLKN
jgi:L-proline amide hydrolase